MYLCRGRAGLPARFAPIVDNLWIVPGRAVRAAPGPAMAGLSTWPTGLEPSRGLWCLETSGVPATFAGNYAQDIRQFFRFSGRSGNYPGFIPNSPFVTGRAMPAPRIRAGCAPGNPGRQPQIAPIPAQSACGFQAREDCHAEL